MKAFWPVKYPELRKEGTCKVQEHDQGGLSTRMKVQYIVRGLFWTFIFDVLDPENLFTEVDC